MRVFLLILIFMEKVQKFLETRLGVILTFFFLSFLLFPQIGLFQNVLKWDAIDCFLPWRLNVSEALNSGEWPWWSAFQHLGFPLHADPDTGALYPVVWIIALVYGYDFYALNFEFCFHIFLAGWGMYRLVRYHDINHTIAWLAGLAFMSNGIFMSNAQNYAFLIGMAWFPFVFLAILKSLQAANWRNTLELSISSFMFIAGSYPGVVIIGIYVLAGYTVVHFIKQFVDSDFSKALKHIRHFIFKCALPVAAVCAFPIVASFETYNEITRTAGLNEKRLNQNPFPPKAYISILTPYAVGTTENVDWGSDFSMINFFMGLPFIIGFVSWLFSRDKSRKDWIYLIVAIFLMLAALGAHTPLRTWLANLPAMGLFRHPSIFRFIAVTFFILIAARGLTSFFTHMHKKKAIILGISAIPFLLLLAPNITNLNIESISGVIAEFQSKDGSPHVSLGGRIAIQSFLFLVIISVLLISSRPKMFVFTSVFIAFVCIQLNIYATMVNNHLVARENKKLENLIASRTAYNGEAIASYHSDSVAFEIPFIWRNEGIYIRKPAWDGYNSFIFARYNKLEESGKLLDFKNKPLAFSFKDESQMRFSNWQITTNKIAFDIEAITLDKVVLLQTWLPMWKARVDGKPVNIGIFQDAFPEIEVPIGTHKVEFEYVPEKTQIAGIFSLLAFLIVLFMASRFSGR